LPSWKEFQSRRPTERELCDWFSRDDTGINVGIVTGRLSGLVVVDCDTAEDAAFWLMTYPVSPLVVTTGRGGSHSYYQFPEASIGNRSRVLGRCIDIRGEGGLVVAPPSRHPESGKPYTWTTFGNYSLADVPYFDPSWIGDDTASQHSAVDAPCLTETSMPRSRRGMRRIRGLLRYLDDHESEPDRSARDFACVMGLLRLGCSPAEIAELVRGHSKFRGSEGYLKVTISNALKAVGRK
jgi:hypothetical protein